MKLPQYPQFKPSEVERLGDIPKHWEIKRLKYVASANDDTLAEDTSPDFEMLYVDIGSVDAAAGIVFKEPMVFDSAPSRARRLVMDGDTIVSTVRTYLKAIAPIEQPEPNLIVSTGFAVIRPKGVNPRFLSACLRSSYFVESIVSRSVGVSYPATNANEVVSISIPLPSLPEQHSIAAFLDREIGRIDRLVGKKRELIERLQEKRTALISRTVTRGLPPAEARTAGLNPHPKLKPSNIDWLGDVPQHWDVKKLGYGALLQGGYAFASDSFQSDGVSVVRMNNLKRGRLDLEDANCIDESICDERFSLHEGDLLWGMSGSIGETGSLGNFARVAAKDVPCQLNQRVGRFRIRQAVLAVEYLAYVIQTSFFYDQVLLRATGTAQFNVSSEQVQSCRILFPPVPEQCAIAVYLDRETTKLDALAAKVETAIERLLEYRTALITAAVTGKIDVRKEVA